MNSAADLLTQAQTAIQAQRLDVAEQCFHHLLKLYPDHADGLYGLGLLLAQQGRAGEAIRWLERAVRARSEHPQTRHNFGVMLGLAGRPREARLQFEEALRLQPIYPEACYNLGNILGTLGLAPEAIASYRRALTHDPDHCGSLTNLGLILQKSDAKAEAVECLRRAARLQPQAAEAFNNLGLALEEAGQPAEAVVMLQQAARLKTPYGDALNNLGKALFALGRFEEAESCLQDALRARPQHAEIHANLGSVLQARGRWTEALACFDLALLYDPGSRNAHYNRAMVLLQTGAWREGWAEYEYRWGLQAEPERHPRQTRWDGTSLKGKTILTWVEQGLGDIVMFLRYAKLLKTLGARVVLECPRHLVSFLRTCPDVDQFISEGDPMPAFAVQAPLASLPGLLGTMPESVPAPVPYLHANPELVERWRHELDSVAGKKIGMVWQGSPRHRFDRFRSVSLSQFGPLANVDGVRLISLQVGPATGQLATIPFPVIDLGSQFRADSLEDLAAVLVSLDLVVTVDTLVAHVAGALNAPVWVALSALPDWRWTRQGERSAWYPSMRLFRQPDLGQWQPVFKEIAQALTACASASG